MEMTENVTYTPVKLVVVTFENGAQKVDEFTSGENMIKYAEMMKEQSVTPKWGHYKNTFTCGRAFMYSFLCCPKNGH